MRGLLLLLLLFAAALALPSPKRPRDGSSGGTLDKIKGALDVFADSGDKPDRNDGDRETDDEEEEEIAADITALLGQFGLAAEKPKRPKKEAKEADKEDDADNDDSDDDNDDEEDDDRASAETEDSIDLMALVRKKTFTAHETCEVRWKKFLFYIYASIFVNFHVRVPLLSVL